MSQLACRDRFRGCLLGLAACDALGTTLEFKPPGTFRPIDGMTGGGPFNLEPGQWTDDTSRPCAWPQVSWKRVRSTPWTRCNATCAGGMEATSPPQGNASTLETPSHRH